MYFILKKIITHSNITLFGCEDCRNLRNFMTQFITYCNIDPVNSLCACES